MAAGGKTTRSFAWDDPFDLVGQLSEDEKLVRDSARAFAQGYLFPRVTEDYLQERFDREIMTRMGSLGLLGPAIPQEYGGAGLGHVADGSTARSGPLRTSSAWYDIETYEVAGLADSPQGEGFRGWSPNRRTDRSRSSCRGEPDVEFSPA